MGKILKIGCGSIALYITVTFTCICITTESYRDLTKAADSARIADSTTQVTEDSAGTKSELSDSERLRLVREAVAKANEHAAAKGKKRTAATESENSGYDRDRLVSVAESKAEEMMKGQRGHFHL